MHCHFSGAMRVHEHAEKKEGKRKQDPQLYTQLNQEASDLQNHRSPDLGVEDVRSGVGSDLVARDLVEHEHDPHGEGRVEAGPHLEHEHVPAHDHPRPLVHLPLDLRHHLRLLPLGPGRRHHAAAPPREGSVDAEQLGGARRRGERREELDDGPRRGAAEDGGPAGREERLLAVGAGAQEALPALVQRRAPPANGEERLPGRSEQRELARRRRAPAVAPAVGVGAEGQPARAAVVGREAVAGGEVRGLAHRQDALLGVAVLGAHDRHRFSLPACLLPLSSSLTPRARACLLASAARVCR
uniref:Uncharacterized protein n=1 Tax=Setaria italica TaxID=4555 RepID=K3XKI1_SETIT